MATELLRIRRDQLRQFIDDQETIEQIELLFELVDEADTVTLVNLRTDVDANTVRSTTNQNSITDLQNEKADILDPTFTNDIAVNGNIVVIGTVDGRDVGVDGSKLDTIETGATADQTAAEIKTAYESNADTNAFTDADESKLDGIEAGATATPSIDDNGNATAITIDASENVLFTKTAIDANVVGVEIATVGAINATRSSGTALNLNRQGTDGTIAVFRHANGTEGSILTNGAKWLLNATTEMGIQTGGVDAFTIDSSQNVTVAGTVDGRDIATDGTKLDGIEALADVTDQANVTSSLGAVDSAALNTSAGAADAGKLIKLDADGQVDATMINDADINLDNVTEGTTNKFFTATDETKLDGIETGAQVNTVDSVAGKTGVVTLVKGDVGLGNVDNTSDADKPISTATQTALDAKFDDFTKNSQTPTTGFSITLTQDTSNQWLILNPSTSLASGTITLIAPGSAADLQEVLISTTKQITSINIAGNGATSVYGAPAVLAAGVTYRFKYDSALTSWFTI